MDDGIHAAFRALGYPEVSPIDEYRIRELLRQVKAGVMLPTIYTAGELDRLPAGRYPQVTVLGTVSVARGAQHAVSAMSSRRSCGRHVL